MPLTIFQTPSQNIENTQNGNPYEAVAPSQQTYEEMHTKKDNNPSSSLKAAPPGGTPIGGVSLGMPVLTTFVIPFIIYLIVKRKK